MLEEKPNMATQKEEEEEGGSAAQQVTKESRCFQEWRYSILFLQAEKSFQAPFHAFESVSYSNFDIYTICSMKKKTAFAAQALCCISLVDLFYIPSFLRGEGGDRGAVLMPWRSVDRPRSSQGEGK